VFSAPPMISGAQPQLQNDFGAFMCNFVRLCACFSALWQRASGSTKHTIRENITVFDEEKLHSQIFLTFRPRERSEREQFGENERKVIQPNRNGSASIIAPVWRHCYSIKSLLDLILGTYIY